MSLALVQEARQSLTLTAAQQFSLNVLQMTEAEVADLIEEEASENPFLESSDAPAAERDEELPAPATEYEPLERMYERWGSGEADDVGPLDFAAGEVSMTQALLEETLVLAQNPAQEAILHILVASLDERGLLIQPIAELQAAFAVPEATAHDWARAQELLQNVEPGGFAARDTAEMLACQVKRKLRERECDEAAGQALLEALADGLAAAAALSPESPAGELLRSLTPRPAAAFGSVKSSYITPDLRVSRTTEGVVIVTALGRRCTLVAHKRGSAEKTFFTRAKTLAQAVEARRSTLVALAQYVCRAQAGFLFDEAPLVVLYQKDAADALGLSGGTVSRTIAGKYVQTPRGTLSLQSLFCEAGAGSGGELTREDVRGLIAELVAKEDPKSPLSDADMVALLAERGLTVARRTVALYRTELGIPGRSKRRVR